MPTLRSAAALLASAVDLPSLAAIAAAVGCDGAPAPLDGAAQRALGLPEDCLDAHVARGPATLRALLLDIDGQRPSRDVLALLARRLSTRAPHLLWLVIACNRRANQVAVAAWAQGNSGPKVAALVVDRTNIADSDAETICALSSALEPVDVLTHARWNAVLGREAITRRFYRTLERLVRALADGATGRAPAEARRDIALLYASRLLFLSFLETKEWLDGDRAFLARRFDQCMDGSGRFQRKVLAPLFFGTLNTPVRSRAPLAQSLGRIPFLNGGLFARSAIERRHRDLEFTDEHLGRFLSDLLGRYRFTAREESSDWTEAAIDPEMLGRAFESLMAGHERRDTGAFFTPHELVARVTDEALTHAIGASLDGVIHARADGAAVLDVREREMVRERLSRLRLVDPACGSGAFLVHALEQVSSALAALGDLRPIAELRRATLTTSIFGVDINPTAVWLCQLRLWLSIVIESATRDPSRVAPLPNLDRHIRIGDALGGDDAMRLRFPGTAGMARLRGRYARAVGARKRTLARTLDRVERNTAIAVLDRRIASLTERRREALIAARGRDLFGGRAAVAASARGTLAELRTDLRSARSRRRALSDGSALPFSFAAHFADVAASGGFDVVIGNPPWVRVHRIAPQSRAQLRRDFASYRGAAWQHGATAARAGAGFGGQVDLAALFIERSLAITRPGGVVGLLVPAKLWRSLAGGGVRRLVAEEHGLLALDDWSEAPSLFDAAVYPSVVVVRRGQGQTSAPASETRVTVRASRVAVTWTVHPRELAVDDTPGAPWLLLPPQARRAFDVVRDAGVSLGTASFGTPVLGVKCGCNGAFIVRCSEGKLVSSNGAAVDIEPEMLRPLIRGEHVMRWRVEATGERVIWTHGADGLPLAQIPARAERWLRGWRRRLIARSDARGAGRWWSLFRTEAAANDVTRVIWADFGREPKATVLPRGDASVPLNTCYAARCHDPRDAYALAVILNSALAKAWLAAVAEPARGGYRRYLGWTLSMLPLPEHWSRVRDGLADIGQRAVAGHPPCDSDLLAAVLDAYGLRRSTVLPLLDWSLR